jgi:hypothetical protein
VQITTLRIEREYGWGTHVSLDMPDIPIEGLEEFGEKAEEITGRASARCSLILGNRMSGFTWRFIARAREDTRGKRKRLEEAATGEA